MKGRIVVIGASLNGLAFLQELVAALPPDFQAAVFIVQHVAAHTPSLLPQILSKAGPLVAAHPGDCELIVPGRIYVAPSDRHMLIRPGMIRIAHGPKENFVRPAVDPLFRSAAIHYGQAVVGVILTGQLDDGTAGAMAIKENGGVMIVQQPSEATAPSMPLSALRNVDVDHCAPVKAIAELLIELVKDPPAKPRLPVRALLRTEDRIAEGAFTVDDVRLLEHSSVASGLNCPECHSALFELPDKRLLRFRCRAGHACSSQSLLGAQADAREEALSSVFGALVEEAALARRVSVRGEYADDDAARTRLAAEAQRLESQADQIRGWLRATPCQAEAERQLVAT